MNTDANVPRTTRADVRVGRVAVLTAPMRTRLERTVVREPSAGEVRVLLEGCGVCASNLPVWEGRPWFEYPREPGSPGHEGWGVVDAVGSTATGVAVGDRVSLLSYHAFATHDYAEAANVVRMPDRLADVPFPGEAVGCAQNVFQRCGIQAEDTVCVVGVGFLGALLIQLAHAAG